MSLRISTAITNKMARVGAVIEAKIKRLFDLQDPANCPERFLHELAWQAGFDALQALWADVQAEANAAQIWRRVIRFAAQRIWATKGQHEVTRNIVRLFTGARVFIGDWFSFRTVWSSTPTAYPMFATQAIASGGEDWTEVHIEDWDGNLNRTMAEHAIEAVRPAGERINVTYADFVEDWQQGIEGRWTPAGEVAIASNVLVLGPHATLASEVRLSSGDQSGWDQETYNVLVRVPSGERVDVRVRDDNGGNYYEVRVSQGVGPGNIELRRNGILKATATHSITADADALLNILTLPLFGSQLEVQVWVDATKHIAWTDASPLTPAGMRLSTPATGTASVVWIEALPGNPDQTTLGA